MQLEKTIVLRYKRPLRWETSRIVRKTSVLLLLRVYLDDLWCLVIVKVAVKIKFYLCDRKEEMLLFMDAKEQTLLEVYMIYLK